MPDTTTITLRLDTRLVDILGKKCTLLGVSRNALVTQLIETNVAEPHGIFGVENEFGMRLGGKIFLTRFQAEWLAEGARRSVTPAAHVVELQESDLDDEEREWLRKTKMGLGL